MEGEVDGMSDSREQSIPAESEERVVDIENNPETELSTTVSVEVSKTQIALKARKRTKTGCFSESFALACFASPRTGLTRTQRVENDG